MTHNTQLSNEIQNIFNKLTKHGYRHKMFYQIVRFLISNPSVEALEGLLSGGVDFGVWPEVGIPLWFGLVQNSVSLSQLERILQPGLDVNAKSITSKETALIVAAKSGLTQSCKVLLDHGADISEHDFQGWQAIHHAASSGKDDTLRYLISRGANVNCATALGVSPLHVAAACSDHSENNTKVFHTLCQFGADPNSRDTNGRNAIFLALEQHRHSHLFDLVVCRVEFQIFSTFKRPFWRSHQMIHPNLSSLDYISALFYMSGGIVNWGPEIRLPDCTPSRIWSNCTGANPSQVFTQQCDQLISRHTDEIISICVGLQSLELPSLVLCEIIFEALSFWRRLKFCEIWDRVVAVRHFHERHF